jgi:protein-disulfide isomerase
VPLPGAGTTQIEEGLTMLITSSPLRILVFLLLLWGCEQGASPLVADKPKSQLDSQDPPVAVIYGQPISLESLDEGIKLGLYDLQWQGYQLRKAHLARLFSAAQAKRPAGEAPAPSFQDLLEPPAPPRITLPTDERPVRGPRDAAIQLQVFCSYQSSHCARLAPVLDTLAAEYGELLNRRYYDFPQGFHRYARGAANAVRCVAEQSAPWSFQDSLYAAIDQLNSDKYLANARQLRLHEARFRDCLDKGGHEAAVEQDIQLARSLGLTSVPIVFINGLYIRGPQAIELYRYFIDAELALRGLSAREAEPGIDALLQLLGIRLDEEPERSSASLMSVKTGERGDYRPGDEIVSGIRLLRVEEEGVYVDYAGKEHFLTLQVQESEETFAFMDPSGPDRQRQAPGAKGQGVQAGQSKMLLSRDWVNEQLALRPQLERHIQNAEHLVEGHHLVRLTEVESQPFYTTLGLKSGDVLMRVGEEWVHEGQNPLWDALRHQETVAIILMRNGYPVHYHYKIDD